LEEIKGFMLILQQGIEGYYGLGIHQPGWQTALKLTNDAQGEEEEQGEREEAPLEDAAQGEREYVRERLREEFKREPTERELDEWLRQHTEGY
jgi:hypothetical protein